MGPIPESMSNFGVLTAPADKMTSFLARTRRLAPMKSNSTPTTRFFWKSTYKYRVKLEKFVSGQW